MISAPKPDCEARRLEALRAYHVLDSAREQAYDDITKLASFICETPVAMISLVDDCRQWFKSKTGTETQETSRDVAFCAHTILDSHVFVVPDASNDTRFADNPLVTGESRVRFYAGAPLLTHEGYAMGALCVTDRVPRSLSREQTDALEALARQTIALMELRRVSAALAESVESVKILHGMLPICCYCKRIRDDAGYWNQVDEYIHNHSEAKFTHGACAECAKKAMEDFRRSVALRNSAAHHD